MSTTSCGVYRTCCINELKEKMVDMNLNSNSALLSKVKASLLPSGGLILKSSCL